MATRKRRRREIVRVNPDEGNILTDVVWGVAGVVLGVGVSFGLALLLLPVANMIYSQTQSQPQS